MTSVFNLNELPTFYVDEDIEGGSQEHSSFMASDINLNETTYTVSGDMEEGLPFDLNQDPPTSGLHPEVDQPAQEQSHHQPSQRRLNIAKKMEILHSLLNRASMRQLPVGTIGAAAQEFNVSVRTVSRIWQTAKHQQATREPFNIATNYHNCGRKRVQMDQEQIASLSIGDRLCIRNLASKISISKSSCHRMIKRGLMRPYTNPLHPGLTDLHKKKGLEWILKHLQGDTMQSKSQYIPMYDYVHLVEK